MILIFQTASVYAAGEITGLGDKLKEFIPGVASPQMDAFTKKLNENPELVLGKKFTELLSKLRSNNKNLSNVDDPSGNELRK